MSVSLRLSRGGSKKRPFFRIVAADIRAPRDGRYIERLGTYNPMREKDDPQRIYLNLERIKYWISVGAQPTDRVKSFLAKEGLVEKTPIPKQTKQDKPKKKTIEKLKAKEEKLKAAKEMEKAAEQASAASTEDKPAEAAAPAESKPAKVDAPAESKPAEVDAPAESKPTEAAAPAENKPAEAAAAAESKPAEAAASPDNDKATDKS